MAVKNQNSIEQVIREDGRYPQEAFAFLHESLSYAVKQIHGDKKPKEGEEVDRHVSGEQLCWAIRDLALERYGFLARCVLNRWNIFTTMDFGNMVYLLVNNGFMRKTPNDSIDDFRNVYLFESAFETDLESGINLT